MKLAQSMLCVAVLMMASSAVNAASLGLVQTFPDVNTSGLEADYTFVSGSGGVLNINTANALASVQFTAATPPPASGNSGGRYDMSATFDTSGNFVSGNFTIMDVVGTIGGAPNTVLLSGTYDQFGSTGTGSAAIFEFIGTVTGGFLAGAYGGNGAQVGTIFDIVSSQDFVDFVNDFSSGTGARADTFSVSAVPTPAATGLFFVPAMMAILRRRRRT